ncbi:MAG: PIG-L family deacetylase [Clostridia bacterium]|nr:PIG-L family deacetylase [Clostridia bacterium]
MKVLVFAPHADDEVLGVGGTIAKHVAAGDDVYVCIATRPTPPVFDDALFERIRRETKQAHKFLKIKKTFFLEYPAVNLESIPRTTLNRDILSVIEEVRPEVVYMPHFGDMQKDHTLLAEAIMVAIRPKHEHKIKRVLAYETLSETEWNAPHASTAFIPNVYNDISDTLDIKLRAMSFFESQLADFPCPRSTEAIASLAKLRGSTIFANAAESFMLIREVNV